MHGVVGKGGGILPLVEVKGDDDITTHVLDVRLENSIQTTSVL